MWNFLIFSPKFSLIRFSFLFFGILLLVLSWWRTLFSESEKSVLFLIDNSLSMAVQDISMPSSELASRLDASKNFIKNFIEKNALAVSVVSFSREITLETPFTTDKKLATNVISGISPLLYGGGSDILHAIEGVTQIYKTRKNIHIIMFSDMETFDNLENFPTLPDSFSLTLVGVGTEQGGLMLEWYTASGQPSYRQFEGKNAISRLDKNTLKLFSEKFSAETCILEKFSDFESVQEKIFEKILQKSSWVDIGFLIGILFLLIWVFFPVYKIATNEKEL